MEDSNPYNRVIKLSWRLSERKAQDFYADFPIRVSRSRLKGWLAAEDNRRRYEASSYDLMLFINAFYDLKIAVKEIPPDAARLIADELSRILKNPSSLEGEKFSQAKDLLSLLLELP